MTDAWYAAGYLARSRYRLAVCNQLYDSGPSLPSELAVATELAQPHVSRALGQLRDEGLVELLVPESKQKGRLYGLTENGRDAVVRLRMRQLEFPVDVVGRDEFPHSSLIEYLESTVPNQMRAVAYHDGDRFVLYFADADIRDQYDEETVTEAAERIWNRQQYESVVDDGTLGARQYVVRGFDRAVVVDVYTEETATVTLSFDPAFDEPISTFVGNCVAHLDRPERT